MAALHYEGDWASKRDLNEFGERLVAAWSTSYLSSTGGIADDLVTVDPGNGFEYLFDLAGSPRAKEVAWPPRVVGVWGRSGRSSGRDVVRMRGHPRPKRGEDDRGHLISCAAGGGYDINLVPMNAALNRGWSDEGARFRAMERRAADSPGTLYFVHVDYEDNSDRPCRFEVGVQDGDGLIVAAFANESCGPTRRSPRATLQQAFPFGLNDEMVTGCLDPTSECDGIFSRAWREGPAVLSGVERCRIAGTTGHIAESIVELVLDEMGWHVLWHFAGPGRHGVDVVFLSPDDKVVAIEVKGTLVSGRIPRFSRREVEQMSAAWLDKADNPGMRELGVESNDIYGGVVVVNFTDLVWRVMLTRDFDAFRPVRSPVDLTSLRWLDDP